MTTLELASEYFNVRAIGTISITNDCNLLQLNEGGFGVEITDAEVKSRAALHLEDLMDELDTTEEVTALIVEFAERWFAEKGVYAYPIDLPERDILKTVLMVKVTEEIMVEVSKDEIISRALSYMNTFRDALNRVGK